MVPAPVGFGEGSKGQISLNFNYKVDFKEIFKPNFAYFLTNERCQTYKMGFSFGRLCHAQGVGLVGALGQNLNFPNMAMRHTKLKGIIRNPGYTEKLNLGSTGDLWVWSKGQIPLNFFETVGIRDGTSSNVF